MATIVLPEHLRTLEANLAHQAKKRLHELKQQFPPWYVRVVSVEPKRRRQTRVLCILLGVCAAIATLYMARMDDHVYLLWAFLILFFQGLLSLFLLARAAWYLRHREHPYLSLLQRKEARQRVLDLHDLKIAAVNALAAHLATVAPRIEGLGVAPRSAGDATRVRVEVGLEDLREYVADRCAYRGMKHEYEAHMPLVVATLRTGSESDREAAWYDEVVREVEALPVAATAHK